MSTPTHRPPHRPSPPRLFWLLWIVAFWSCKSSGPSYPNDGVLTLWHAQVKATHNSYHVKTTDGVQDWDYSMQPLDVQARAQGVRSFELDANYDADSDKLEVYHLSLIDEGTTCRAFSDCLATIKRWSDANRRHLPLYIQIEPKSGFTGAGAERAFARLEGEIRAVFGGDRIITPASIQGTSATLREAVKTRGWPTLAASRGKVLFGWDDHDEVRRLYTHGLQDLAGRLLFADSSPEHPFAAIAVLNDPVGQMGEITAAVRAGMLVRTRADDGGMMPLQNDRTLLTAALASGAHFISTDYPSPVPGRLYSFDIPAGRPARCNPLSAVGTPCSPETLENGP